MCGYGALRAPSRNFRPVTLLAMGRLIKLGWLGILPLMPTGALSHHREKRAGPEVRTWRPLSEVVFRPICA